MKHTIRHPVLPIAVLIAAATLGGCTQRSNANTNSSSQIEAEKAAIRRTLATTQERINRGDLGFVDVFTNDAVIMVPSGPDVTGLEAIRTTYSNLLKEASMTVHFSTEEIAIAGDLAVERGTYTIKISNRSTGRTLQDAKNKHMHILKKQQDGAWKTWRMMVNSAEAVAEKR